MKNHETGPLIPVGKIVEETGISASRIFKAAESETINLAVPIKRGTAYTFIEELVDNDVITKTVDTRLICPVHHPDVSALLLTRETCSELADCSVTFSRFFKGGLIFKLGKCVKALMTTKRTFIPGRSELYAATRLDQRVPFLPEFLNPDVLQMIRDGGAYCSTTSSKRLSELTGVLHFDAHNRVDLTSWPLSSVCAWRPFRHIQCYQYRFGVYDEIQNNTLLSEEQRIKPPKEIKLNSENLLLSVSDLEKIIEYTDNELEIEKIKKFVRSIPTGPVEAVSTTPQPVALLEDPDFPMSQDIARKWVETVCQVRARRRAPVDAVYRFAAVAVHGWRKIMIEKIESRHFGKHLQTWLEESEIAKDDATKLAPLVRNEKGHKHRKQLKVSTGDDSPWENSNLQHFLLALLDCTERKFQNESRNSEDPLIPPREAFISALRKDSSIAETTAEASFRLANNNRLEGALLKAGGHT